jgi:phosphoglycolate phosphatase-like HAD superfamily hydrolase
MDAQDDVCGLRGEGLILDAIAAVMFEPVGCLAEFRAEEFDVAAREVFGSTEDIAATGSLAYWRLLGLIDRDGGAIVSAKVARLEELELAAVEHAELYEDVRPSLEKLREIGVNAHLVSSLSRRALVRFIARFDLADLFAGSVAREESHGVMAWPLRHVIDQASLDPHRFIYLVDTAEALTMAKQLGVNALLMINDYDEGRALAERSPSGGVVSLAELADALQLIEQRSGLRSTERMPLKPFELFEPG